MRLILVGCEYAGKTTLGNEITGWIGRTLGGGRSFHDHFTIPSPELEGTDRDLVVNATPRFKEMFQRYQMNYHLHPFVLLGPRPPADGLPHRGCGLCAPVLRVRRAG